MFCSTLTRVSLVWILSLTFVTSNWAQENEQSEIYSSLCQLNQGWLERAPNYAALPNDWEIESETTLIQTHLRLVIDELRNADVSHLNAAQHAARAAHIETLQEYMLEGTFPQNIYVAGRRPVFIDPFGTHCAVGHLIAESGRSDLAVKINDEHQLDFLGQIQTDGLVAWQVASGLSLKELALIQPSYVYVELHYPREIEELILGNPKPIMKLIEDEPTLVNGRCGGKTLLHFAAAAGNLELCKFLVAHGADLHSLSYGTQRPKPKKQDSPSRPRIGVFSSSTMYTAIWNGPTKVGRPTSGRRMGRGGRVYSTQLGTMIAFALRDTAGGIEGKNALYFATLRAGNRVPFRTVAIGAPITRRKPVKAPVKTKVDLEIEKLVKDRAEVADWLRANGVKSL